MLSCCSILFHQQVSINPLVGSEKRVLNDTCSRLCYQLTLHHPCHPSFLSLVFTVTSYHCLSSLMSSLVIVIILVIVDCCISACPSLSSALSYAHALLVLIDLDSHFVCSCFHPLSTSSLYVTVCLV